MAIVCCSCRYGASAADPQLRQEKANVERSGGQVVKWRKIMEVLDSSVTGLKMVMVGNVVLYTLEIKSKLRKS